MSALRRGWRATTFDLEHGGMRAHVWRLGDGRWLWWIDAGESVHYAPTRADSLSAAQAAVEAAIEQRLARLTREEIILEAARVDCREVRS